jgi:hypothetical protein
VIGDDQREMFLDDGTPAFGIFHGDAFVDASPDPRTMHPSIQLAYWSQHADAPESYPVNAELATHLIENLVCDGFDIAAYAQQPAGRTVGHAFTFVRRRLMRERINPIPIVPVFVNCFYAPNQPTAARCSELRNWLVLAGAMEDCDIDLLDYVPAYRSSAKTGCGMGFVRWNAPRPLAVSGAKEHARRN